MMMKHQQTASLSAIPAGSQESNPPLKGNAPLRLATDALPFAPWPERFRIMAAPCCDRSGSMPASACNTAGLEQLRASGSGQFSPAGLANIIKELAAPALTIVDLRQESHGFVNGRAVSWQNALNSANRSLSEEAVLLEEARLLREAALQECGKDGPALIMSEAELVRREKADYVRFFVTDRCRPEDETVDRFISFIQCRPREGWLHFHCLGGSGRTTTFLIMLDMMRHAGDISCGDILHRHKQLGGRDMFAIVTGNPSLVQSGLERLRFIHAFYDYCLDAAAGGFRLPWSAWQAKGHSAPFSAPSPKPQNQKAGPG